MSEVGRRFGREAERALQNAETIENQVAANVAATLGVGYALLSIAAVLIEGVVYVKDSDRA